jgi:tetratricopeptide (TPR) repeat protein
LAEDKKVYDKAIREGLNFAWEGQWKKAMAAYRKAVAAAPDDAIAYNHLGLAYFELERFEEALGAYSHASRLAPEDPAPLTRIAEVHERLGQRHSAADAWFSLAGIHVRQQAWREAVDALQRVIQLHPDHLLAHQALTRAHGELDQPKEAASAHVNLGRLQQRQGQGERALEQCRRALELDPHNTEARRLADALQSGTDLDEIEAQRPSPLPLGDGSSPLHIARDRALEELAAMPFEEIQGQPASEATNSVAPALAGEEPPSMRPEIDALVTQAIDYQTRGLIDEAIGHYVRAIDAGVNRPAAYFSLGLLYRQRLRLEPAIECFTAAAQHPQYELGSHLALGECYRAQGLVGEALDHLLQAVKIVDLGTVQPEQADDLISLYDTLAERHIGQGNRDKALTFAHTLVKFLFAEGWEESAHEARQRLDSVLEEGVTVSLAEMLTVPNADSVLGAMALSQEYVRRGAFTAATETCYRAIQSAPSYLPLHLRLAEILVEENRIEDAVAKYQVMAEVYLVREEPDQAIGVYQRILRLVPMDVVIRARLIELLVSSGEIDQALDQYLALADAYYQMAQVTKSVEKYGEALRLVDRASDASAWRVRLLRKMADIQLRRADWKEAVGLYRQLVSAAPEDERARLNLIDLYYKLGRTREGDQATVEMIDYYRTQGETERLQALLEEAVRLQPQQMALRARLAGSYIEAGMRDEAVSELDTLGELQLDAGLREQTLATVRLIISLEPKNVDAYRQLLAQL